MTTPRTKLDARFSEPGAEPTSWQDTLAAIEQAEPVIAGERVLA